MEAANMWEVSHARAAAFQQLPDYGDHQVLADKSLGHILGPLAVLDRLGFAVESSEMASVRKILEQYLIARQLNDDAHDWQADLAQGQFNSVAVMVLSAWQKQGGGAVSPGGLAEAMPQLQQLFWNEVMGTAGELIFMHTTQARSLAGELTLLSDSRFIEALIKPLEHAVNMAKSESGRARDFLRSFDESQKGVYLR